MNNCSLTEILIHWLQLEGWVSLIYTLCMHHNDNDADDDADADADNDNDNDNIAWSFKVLTS